MSAQQGNTRGGAGDDGAPDPKRQRMEDQGAPDPTKMVIKLAGHAKTFVVNRQTAIDNSLYFRTAMSGDWPNSRTGVVELEDSDYATLDNITLLKKYFEYLEDIAINAGTDNELEPDPLQELEDFEGLANFWLLGDYIQSQKITDAIMEEFETRSDDMELMSEKDFKDWWEILGDQPVYEKLRGAMLALFVASDAFKDADTRHRMMRSLPADAQEAIVDELVRQHEDVHDELSEGLERLVEHVDDEGYEELGIMRAKIDKKVVARDWSKSYTNRRDRL